MLQRYLVESFTFWSYITNIAPPYILVVLNVVSIAETQFVISTLSRNSFIANFEKYCTVLEADKVAHGLITKLSQEAATQLKEIPWACVIVVCTMKHKHKAPLLKQKQCHSFP